MSKFRIRSGDVDRTGRWCQGSFDEYFEARDFDAAKVEADRALRSNEIRGIESGRFVRIDGPERSARRSMGHDETWVADADPS